VDASPTDAISAIKFSPYPNSTKLAAASWDKHVYLYEYIAGPNGASECRLVSKFEHRAPVLDVCFGTSDEELYTAGLDWDVRKYVSLGFTEISWTNCDPGSRSHRRHKRF
jgi:cell cycle arrest protein BUB3